MSVSATYKLLLDTARDESFATELPVVEMEWNNGMSDSFDVVADVTSLQAVVSNADGALTRGIYGDFTPDARTEERVNEALANGGFDAWTASEPDDWLKYVYNGGMTTSETASGGGAGTGALHVTGTGAVAYRQHLTAQRLYEIKLVVSEFSGNGRIQIRLRDSVFNGSLYTIQTIKQTGTITIPITVEEETLMEVYIVRLSGTFTVTIDSVSALEILASYHDLQPVMDPVPAEELVSNGSFAAWTAGVPDDWALFTGSVNEVGSGEDHTGAGSGAANLYSAGGTAAITSNVVAMGGRMYAFTVIVSYFASTGSNAQLDVGFSTTADYDPRLGRITGTGTHTLYITHPGEEDTGFATAEIMLLARCSSGTIDVTVDSIEVHPVVLIPKYIDKTDTGYRITPSGSTGKLVSPYRGTLLKVVASYMEVENQQLWIGKVESVEATPSIHDERLVTITCKDPMNQFRERDYLPPFLQNQRVDQVLTTMLKNEPAITYPYASSYWIPGVAGSSEPGQTTYPYDGPPMNFDTGISVIPYTGDNSDRAQPSAMDDRDIVKQGVSQLAFIRDLMMAEVDGRFFWDGRASEFVFHSRHHDLTTTEPTVRLDNWVSSQPIGSDVVYTEVEVYYQPREIGTAGSVLWTAPEATLPITLRPGQPVRFQIRYADPDSPETRIGAMDIIQPVPELDIQVHYDQEGTSPSRIKQVRYHVEARGNGAIITLATTRNKGILYVTLLRLRGTPIRTYQSASVKAAAPDALALNDPQRYEYRAQLVATRDEAVNIANFLLRRYQTPKRRLRTLTYLAQSSDARMRNMLTLTVGSLITAVADFIEHESIYLVVGEQHRINIERNEHYVTYVLKPRGNLEYWILGDAERSILGVSTVPVF